LVKLAAAAIHVINIGDFSAMIHDLAIKRRLIELGEEVVNTAYSPHMDFPAERQIESAEQKLFHLAVEGDHNKDFRALRHSITDAIQRAERALQNASHISGVDTGLADLNDMLGGLQASDLVILAGRPSMGKTALATNIAHNAAQAFAAQTKAQGLTAREGKSVGFFSLEMSSEQLATRLLAAACKFPSQKMTRGTITQDEFNTLVRVSAELGQLPFHIDDTPALSIAALRSRARRLKRVHNMGLLVVDYLQLVRPASNRPQDGRVQEVSEITQGLKAIAKELNVPVVALSQLSRAVESREDKRPLLSDLRESGSIEQDADVVMFIFREEYYISRQMPSQDDEAKMAKWQEDMERVLNVAEVIVAKHRNGPIGTVRLRFDSNLTQFSDLAKSGHYQLR
ncbi:MAG: replicative DNA helicase, partial [Alphaproteobacteria bacterium]|nr:replicative DNA helicase [Alphaproteobacteria bacterium]